MESVFSDRSSPRSLLSRVPQARATSCCPVSMNSDFVVVSVMSMELLKCSIYVESLSLYHRQQVVAKEDTPVPEMAPSVKKGSPESENHSLSFQPVPRLPLMVPIDVFFSVKVTKKPPSGFFSREARSMKKAKKVRHHSEIRIFIIVQKHQNSSSQDDTLLSEGLERNWQLEDERSGRR